MAELELPQISFARYLDLLKRRRWQVVPLSLLGLLIGGAVAFLIPRYYVAETLFMFNGKLLGDKLDITKEDPLASVVGLARAKIPVLVGETLQRLKWPEVMTENLDSRRAFEHDVKSRVVLDDVGDVEKRRVETRLRLSFRDTDGNRAAEFTNALRETWLETETEDIRHRMEVEIEQKRTNERDAQKRLEDLRKDVATFERDNRINPDDLLPGRPEQTERTKKLEDQDKTVATLRARVDALKAEISSAESMLSEGLIKATTERTEVIENPVLKAEYEKAKLELMAAQLRQAGLTPAHPDRELANGLVKEKEALVKSLSQSYRTERKVTADNAARDEFLKDQARRKLELAEKSALLLAAEPRLKELQDALAKWPGVRGDYDTLRAKREAAVAEHKDRQEKLREGETSQREFMNLKLLNVIYAAAIPRRPTEPNITLVAIAGGGLGLALAIVLILLLDFVRTSFKTLDDVERGLTVPVLGSLAHMETDEERQIVQHRRARASLIAGAFLTLLVAVVTIYYVAPARLPLVVRQVLSLLLG